MLQRINETDFPEIYRIMQASFPDDEYRPYEEQFALLKEPEYRIYYKPAGFLAVWEFERFSYIEHFAVDPALRNSGTGSAMLQELILQELARNESVDASLADLRYEGQKKPICLEVELPEDELTKRRIGFYERNGFVFNEYPYMQPPISKGKSPVPLRIMTYGAAITEETFEEIKHVLYRRVYKVGV